MEKGNLDEAEAKLKEAIKADPNPNASGAHYYLKLIKERRFAEQVRRQYDPGRIIATGGPEEPDTSKLFPQTTTSGERTLWKRTSNGADRPPGGYYTSPRRAAIAQKLQDMVFNDWRLPKGMALSEVLKKLQRQTRQKDAEDAGVHFIIDNGEDRAVI